MTFEAKQWVSRAERIQDGQGYTYASLARDMVDALGWTTAADVATALRAHVYGSPGGHTLHAAVRPLYGRLGWEQAALLAAWFRNTANRPGAPKRAPGWPQPAATVAAPPDATTPTPEEGTST
ncbi:hypothetical protein [Streptomyces longwoodensis]|uniref:hypothetical protein n=1 Tax=Streptomyces longwoodensis TaxID=68231 RepID=UPI0033C32D2C